MVHCSLGTFIKWSLNVLSFLWFHPLILILPLEPTEQVCSLGQWLEAAAGMAAAMAACLPVFPVLAQDTLSSADDGTFCHSYCSPVDTERKRGLRDKPPGPACYTTKGVTELDVNPGVPTSQSHVSDARPDHLLASFPLSLTPRFSEATAGSSQHFVCLFWTLAQRDEQRGIWSLVLALLPVVT